MKKRWVAGLLGLSMAVGTIQPIYATELQKSKSVMIPQKENAKDINSTDNTEKNITHTENTVENTTHTEDTTEDTTENTSHTEDRTNIGNTNNTENTVNADNIANTVNPDNPTNPANSANPADDADKINAVAEDMDDIVEIPDEKLFRALLQKYGNDQNGDGKLSKAEMAQITSVGVQYFNHGGNHYDEIDLTGLEWAVNLEYIEVYGYQVKSYEPLEQLKRLETVKITDAKLKDITEIVKLKNTTMLYLESNEIEDISALENLPNLQILSLRGNQIKNIDVLEKLNHLTDVNFMVNPISDIHALKKMGKNLPSVRLSKNEYEQEIKKQIMEMFVEDLEPVILVGNTLKLVLPNECSRIRFAEDSVFSNDGLTMEDITLSTENKDIAKITESGKILGVSAGETMLHMQVGDMKKSFKISVKKQENSVVDMKKGESELLNEKVCAVLDSDQTLWSVNLEKAEEVKKDAVKYVANVVYGERIEIQGEKVEPCWANYYILDNNNSLWSSQKESYEDAYQTEKIFDNVEKFDDRFALLKNGDLYDLDNQEKQAEHIQTYFKSQSGFGLDSNVLTTEKEFKDIKTGEVYETEVEELQYVDRKYLVLKNGELGIWDSYDKEYIGTIADVKELMNGKIFAKNDGSIWSWEAVYQTETGKDKAKFSKVTDKMPVYCDERWLLDVNHVLWYRQNKPYEDTQFEKVEENVEKVYSDLNMYIKEDGTLMSLNAEWDGYTTEKIAEDVKEVDGNYYQKNDNTVWQIVYDEENDNYIIGDVASFSAAQNSSAASDLFVFRTDGSIWKYEVNRNTNSGQPYMLKEPSVKKGDLSGDNKTSIQDVQMIFSYISQKSDLTEQQLKVADVDNDGKTTMKDVQRLFYYINGRIESL